MAKTTAKQAHSALKIAAEKIGANNYASGIYKVKHNRRGLPIGGYSITAAHQEVIEAMPLVLSGEITPEEAMALLWRDDVMRQRGAK